ncbi:DUF4292 domain-containing protein, partial [Myxococcota bacterium]|nr:DUF4292 domain-containing protein [Myxococcota bacterium]
TGYSRPYSTPNPGNIMSTLALSKINSLRSQGKVDAMMGKGKRVKVKVFLIADRLGRIRFDAVTPPPMNATVLLLTSDGQTFRANDQRNKKYFQGNAGVCAVKAMLGIPLSPAQLFAMLIGEPAVSSANMTLSWDKKCGCEVITAKKGDTTARLWVLGHKGKANWRVVKQVITGPKGKVKVEYRGFKKLNGFTIPHRIRLSSPGKKEDTVFAFTKIEINPEVEVEAFNQEPPAGVEIRRIICGEGATH